MSNIKDNTVVKIANEIAELVEKKNHDYGNSFDKLMDKYGETAFIIRLSDKLNRLEVLAQHRALIEDEKIEDTVKDIIGYSLLYLSRIKDGFSVKASIDRIDKK